MAKPPSPLVGFNNNVKHQGRIYHVQTEDSGIKRPHILTHLFVDGGRIVKSTRTDYSEHIGQADMNATVRRLMKEQHKAMFIALRDGQLDDAISKVLGPVEDAAKEKPPRTSNKPPPLPSKRKSRPPTLTELSTAPPTPAPPAPIPEPAAVKPIPRPAAPTLTDLVLADLEAARARKASAEAPEKPRPKGATPVLGTPHAQARPPVSGRYGASRPAAIFTAPGDQGSIFGGSSISEQSLDEVILSYLAEDLDTPPED